MYTFFINDYMWHVFIVSDDSPMLVDRRHIKTVGTTDPISHSIYISDKLSGMFLIKVLLHELGHCVMISYDLMDDLHSFVYPNKWGIAEEWLCNFISNYGMEIFKTVFFMTESPYFGIDAVCQFFRNLYDE